MAAALPGLLALAPRETLAADAAMPAPAAATPTDAAAAAERGLVAPPPTALWLRWLPLTASAAGAVPRAELRPLFSELERGRHAAACSQAQQLLDARLAEAARLFYAPIRKDADLAAIDRFLAAHVQGSAPMIVIVGEQWSPAPSWRDAAALACARAERFAAAERLLRVEAGAHLGSRVAVALALLRWRRTAALAPHAWLLGDNNVHLGAAGALLAFSLDPSEAAAARLGTLRAAGSAAERALIDDVVAWRRDAAAATP